MIVAGNIVDLKFDDKEANRVRLYDCHYDIKSSTPIKRVRIAFMLAIGSVAPALSRIGIFFSLTSQRALCFACCER